jgi:hypothetical protein
VAVDGAGAPAVAGEGARAPAAGVPTADGDSAGVPGVLSDEQPTLAKCEQPAPTAGEGCSAPGEHYDDEGALEAPVGAANMATGDASVGVPEAPRAD